MNYSIAIRSVRVNELLENLMNSIERQSLLPEDVTVVVPFLEECKLEHWNKFASKWKTKVRIIQSEQGMVSQRAACIEHSGTNLVMLLDDDVLLSEHFAENMISALIRNSAQCAVPYVKWTYPSNPIRRWFLQIFLIAVPYKGNGGNKILLSGGFAYPSGEVPYLESVDTDSGIGAAILIDRDWALGNGSKGDFQLQRNGNPYALREDGALTYAQKLAGGRVIMVNAGELHHFGGTTALDSRRLRWAYEASIVNNIIFWRKYVYGVLNKPLTKMVSVLAIGWQLVGLSIMACATSLRGRDFTPLRGVLEGLKVLVESQHLKV